MWRRLSLRDFVIVRELELELAALRDRRASMTEDEYFAQIEPLLLKLARLYADSIPQPLFPSLLSFGLVGSAMFAAVASTVIAAALPARRAASLDPVQVMR